MSEEMNNAYECKPENCASCGGCGGVDAPFPSPISLTMEDDSVIECAVLAVYPVDEKQYIALVPVDDQGQLAANEVYIYAFSQTEEGDPVLSNILDDDEYDAASLAFDAILENSRLVAEADPE